MLPQEKGGVVDPTLKVYGTNNIRVADLSVVPLHIGSHPQCEYLTVFNSVGATDIYGHLIAAAYAIAEQGMLSWFPF